MTPRPRQSGRLLVTLAVVLTLLIVVAPLIYIFARALSEGWRVYADNILHPDTLHAIWLTSLVALIVVPVNVAFGIAAAWAVALVAAPYHWCARKLYLPSLSRSVQHIPRRRD